MKKFWVVLLGCLSAFICKAQEKPVIIGYVGGFRGLINVNVSPQKL